MPLYEYRCKNCGTEFEKQLRFSEADQLPACPKCNSTQTRKKISSVVSFVFKFHRFISQPKQQLQHQRRLYLRRINRRPLAVVHKSM